MSGNPRLVGRAFGAALPALFAQAALAAAVNTNYLPETDFSPYHSYRWVTVEVEGAKALDSITGEQIKRAVDKQLSAKGWTRTESADAADAYVAYQVAVERQQRVSVYGGYGWGWYGGSSVSQTIVDVGTLTLDVYDPKQKMLIWRGTATDTIKSKSKPEKRQQRLDKAVAKLLKDFPPQKK